MQVVYNEGCFRGTAEPCRAGVVRRRRGGGGVRPADGAPPLASQPSPRTDGMAAAR